MSKASERYEKFAEDNERWHEEIEEASRPVSLRHLILFIWWMSLSCAMWATLGVVAVLRLLGLA